MGANTNAFMLQTKWNVAARTKIPAGSVVTGLAYMSDADMSALGITKRPLVITLKRPDGSSVDIYPMADDEGNDGGALFMWSPNSEPSDDILPTL